MHRIRIGSSDFNPRSHEGSDYIESIKEELGMISIHAPTRGATEQRTELLTLMKISIHAPTRGATQVDKSPKELKRFQSTLPRGERRTRYEMVKS